MAEKVTSEFGMVFVGLQQVSTGFAHAFHRAFDAGLFHQASVVAGDLVGFGGDPVLFPALDWLREQYGF
jgi:hypothetical protein